MRKIDFMKHIEKPHKAVDKVECELCGAKYVNSSSLRRHQVMEHGSAGKQEGYTQILRYYTKQFYHMHTVVHVHLLHDQLIFIAHLHLNY